MSRPSCKPPTVRLRPIRRGDVESTFRWHNDAETSDQILSFPPPVTKESEQRWLRGVLESERSGAKFFRIIEVAGGSKATPAGFIQLVPVAGHPDQRRLGIVIGEEDLRGRGVGSSALAQLIGAARADRAIRRIVLEVRADNPRAIGFYERFGFAKEGRRRLRRRGREVTMIRMSLRLI